MLVERTAFRSGLDGREDYYLRIAADEQVYPGGRVAVYLHGHGGLPEQLFTHPCLKGFPELAVPAGWTILAPNLRGNAWMNASAEADLLQLTLEWRERYQPSRFLLTGGSMGGTSVLIWEGLHPSLYDGFLAYCGSADMRSYHQFCRQNQAQIPVLSEIRLAIEEHYGGTPDQAPEQYLRRSAVAQVAAWTRPTVFVHGQFDALIPVEPARRLAAACADKPWVRYVEIPQGSHDSILSPQDILQRLNELADLGISP